MRVMRAINSLVFLLHVLSSARATTSTLTTITITWAVVSSAPLEGEHVGDQRGALEELFPAQTTDVGSPTTTTTTTTCRLDDGEMCTSPADCCSRHCSPGPYGGFTCGGCLPLGEFCMSSADCCSRYCGPGFVCTF